MAIFATIGIIFITLLFAWTSIQYLSAQQSSMTAKLVQQNEILQHSLEVAKSRTLESIVTPTPPPPEAVEIKEDPSAKGFAYVFYATSDTYACSVLVNIHRLQHVLNVSFPIHVLVSPEVSGTYVQALIDAGSTVHTQEPPPLSKSNISIYYRDCLLKLLAFKMHALHPGLRRVLAFDSDQLILKNLDHLFEGLPAVDLASPRAYWLSKSFLASTFLMINLSDRLWNTVKLALDKVAYNKFDMDLINDLLGDTVMMLSGEYVTLNSHWEDWNLPNWYHPVHDINMTTVELLNKLSKQNFKRDGEQIDAESLAASIDEDSHSTVSSTTTVDDGAQPHQPPVEDPSISSAWPAATTDAIPVPQQVSPRFPENHPMSLELSLLLEAAPVLHFSALGKPWKHSRATVAEKRPDAHPLLAEQYEMWRETALDVCPGGIPQPVER